MSRLLSTVRLLALVATPAFAGDVTVRIPAPPMPPPPPMVHVQVGQPPPPPVVVHQTVVRETVVVEKHKHKGNRGKHKGHYK